MCCSQSDSSAAGRGAEEGPGADARRNARLCGEHDEGASEVRRHLQEPDRRGEQRVSITSGIYVR